MAGFITPIEPMSQNIQGLNSLQGANGASKTNGTSVFQDVFSNAVNDVKDTQANLENQQYLLSTGQIDDAHTVPIAAAEAKLSVDLLVSLRNKAVESYNELMRISL